MTVYFIELLYLHFFVCGNFVKSCPFSVNHVLFILQLPNRLVSGNYYVTVTFRKYFDLAGYFSSCTPS